MKRRFCWWNENVKFEPKCVDVYELNDPILQILFGNDCHGDLGLLSTYLERGPRTTTRTGSAQVVSYIVEIPKFPLFSAHADNVSIECVLSF